MNNTKLATPIIFMSVFIFSVFVYISVINIFPNKSSDSYFATENSQINANIRSMTYKKGKLIITVTGDVVMGCIKTTKTPPNNNSKCWTEVDDNQFSTSVLKNKSYYIWLMDSNGLISNKYDYNSK